MELTPKQLLALPPQDYLLIDMRNSADREYGTIPGSVACSAEQLLQEPPQTAQKLLRARRFKRRGCRAALPKGAFGLQPAGGLFSVAAAYYAAAGAGGLLL